MSQIVLMTSRCHDSRTLCLNREKKKDNTIPRCDYSTRICNRHSGKREKNIENSEIHDQLSLNFNNTSAGDSHN